MRTLCASEHVILKDHEEHQRKHLQAENTHEQYVRTASSG